LPVRLIPRRRRPEGEQVLRVAVDVVQVVETVDVEVEVVVAMVYIIIKLNWKTKIDIMLEVM